MWLDEGLPAGVLRDELSEQLWDDCCASHPDDPFSEWERRKGELRSPDHEARQHVGRIMYL